MFPYNFFRLLFSNTKCHGYTTLKLYERAETKKLLKAHETVGLWFMSGVTATNSSFSSQKKKKEGEREGIC
jgi:hypothetical protein